jgi:L,D-transpeptidase YcbB
MKYFYTIILISIFGFLVKNSKTISEDSNKNLKVTDVLFGVQKLNIDTLLISKYESKNLMAFYKNYNYNTVWQSSENRKIVIDEMSQCETDGLNPLDYKTKELSDLENKINDLNEKEVVDYDILLTNSFQNYLTHLYKGRLNPRKIYNDWDLKENNIDVNLKMFEALDKNIFAEAIKNSKPSTPIYLQLKEALKIINSLPDDSNFKIMKFVKKIKPKETNDQIVNIKKRLMYWNDLKRDSIITKVYDKETQKSMVQFQKRHGLESDGVVGPGTIKALNFYKSERKEQIIANLERWRWYPRDFGTHYSIVNLPNYELDILKKNDTVQTFRVVVGKSSRRSPVLTSKLGTVVFNPTWTVPPTIIKEDLIPDATRSRSYFGKMRIKIFDYKRRVISPWRWKPEDAKKYDYVQDPGNNNSLGNMKILFPNKFSVYLHDTNHRDGFARNFRSTSSGCTRVERPMDLAMYVLNDTARWNKKKIDALLLTKKTTAIKITQEIQHYQLYWTSWVNKNKLIFRDDIYNLDSDLYCRLTH